MLGSSADSVPSHALRIAFLFLVAIHAVPGASSQDTLVKIKATGFAPGSGSRARAIALEKAEASAIKMAIEALLGEEHADLGATLSSQSATFVQSSRRLGLEESDGGTRIAAEVYVRNYSLRLQAATLLLPKLKPPPRVLVLIAEEVVGDGVLSVGVIGTVEKELNRDLRVSGFVVLDSTELRRKNAPSFLLSLVQGEEEAVARFGREMGADVVVTGVARSWIDRPRAGGGTAGAIEHVEARVELNVVSSTRAASTEKLAMTAGIQGANRRDAAQLALRDATRKLRQQVMVSIVLFTRSARSIPWTTLTINRPCSLNTLELIAAELRQANATSVELLRHDADSAHLQFVYSGKIGPLVNRLTEMRGLPCLLETRSVVARELIFDAVPSSDPDSSH